MAATQLGLVTYCLGIHQKAPPALREHKDLTDPLTFLEFCHALGAGGIQISLGTPPPEYLARLRQRAQALAMRVEAILDPPRDAAGLERFEKQVVAATQAGANVARATIMPGRRYEQLKSADEFQRAAQRGLESLQLAEPIVARHRLRLAVENHKDHRVSERLGLLRALSSEYIGACIDAGNNIALLEDPLEVVRALAPWALTVHLKDHAVRPYAEGFLLADAALGRGFLDLPEMVRHLRQARPEVRFNLEVITRDPLPVPVLAQSYWATLGDVPARDLARTWQWVKTHASKTPLPSVSELPIEQQLARERDNIQESLAYARDHLRL